MIKPLYIFLLVPLFLSACSYTTTKQNPEFAKTWNKQYSVAILPPEVTIDFVDLNGKTQAIPEEELKAIKMIKSESQRVLAEKGYNATNFDFVSYIEQNPSFRDEIVNLREGVKKELKTLDATSMVKTEDSVKYTASVGQLANLTSQLTAADLLLYVNYEGFEQSDGLRATNFGLAVLSQALTGQSEQYSPEGGFFRVALIEGSTGNIVWLNTGKANQPVNEFNPDDTFSGVSPLEFIFNELPDKSKSAPKD